MGRKRAERTQGGSWAEAPRACPTRSAPAMAGLRGGTGFPQRSRHSIRTQNLLEHLEVHLGPVAPVAGAVPSGPMVVVSSRRPRSACVELELQALHRVLRIRLPGRTRAAGARSRRPFSFLSRRRNPRRRSGRAPRFGQHPVPARQPVAAGSSRQTTRLGACTHGNHVPSTSMRSGCSGVKFLVRQRAEHVVHPVADCASPRRPAAAARATLSRCTLNTGFIIQAAPRGASTVSDERQAGSSARASSAPSRWA